MPSLLQKILLHGHFRFAQNLLLIFGSVFLGIDLLFWRSKAMVSVISDANRIKTVYKFMPTATYEIDGFTVAKERTLIANEHVDNLCKLVVSKASLIKKALAVEDLPIEVTDDRVSFPWFNEFPELEDS